MTSRLSWIERNSGRHGILLPSDDHQNQNPNPPNEKFFASRIKMYLGLLDCIPLFDGWISSLSHLDIDDTEVTVPPSIGPECPICYDPYIRIANEKKSPTDDDSDWKEIPLRLPCGHVLCKKCVRDVAGHANASTGVVCPFCRASFNHMPITAASGSWDKLLKCMWVTLDIFFRLHSDLDDDEQDMEAVVRWAQDGPRLSHDVPPADKREAIEYAVKSWIDMGDEKFCRDLAVTVLGPRAQAIPQVVRLRLAHSARRPRRASTDGRPTVLIRTRGMRLSRSQDFHASDWVKKRATFGLYRAIIQRKYPFYKLRTSNEVSGPFCFSFSPVHLKNSERPCG